MPSYIKTVSIDYGWRAFSGFYDINNGMGGQFFRIPTRGNFTDTHSLGQYSYIIQEYTDKRSEAASAFIFEKTQVEDFHAADLSKGDGRKYFRYLHAFYTYGGYAAITRVWLSRTRDTTEGDGRTTNINQDRGGDSLYLCWEYEKKGECPQFPAPACEGKYTNVSNLDSHSYSIPLGILFNPLFALFHLIASHKVTAGIYDP